MKSQRFRLMVILALALLLGAAPLVVAAPGNLNRPADSPPIVVDTTDDSLEVDGLCSLREAIDAVNTHAVVDTCGAAGGLDMITLPAGTYILAIPGSGEDDNATGDLDIRANVTIQGAGTETTILNGAQLDRVIQIHSGAAVSLRHITVQGGRPLSGTRCAVGWFEMAYCGDNGGGIHSAGDLTLQNCSVQGNESGPGGAWWDLGFGGNGGRGGGIFVESGTLSLFETQVVGNRTGGGGRGYNTRAGDGGNGGGIYLNWGSTAYLINALIASNGTGVGGPGCFSSRPWWPCPPDSHGRQGRGGGIFNNGATVTASNVTISDNEFGGIDNTGVIRLDFATIAGNEVSNSGDFTLHTSIIPGCIGTLTSAGYNLIGSTAGCTVTGDPTGNLLDIDPKLGLLADNGGPTWTHALAEGSPAMDAGICTHIEGTPVTTDQRGFPRPSGSRCDIGAFEVQQPTIDIKPGEPDNAIDLSQRGKMAVAVLSSEGFDAPNELMWGAFTFGRTGAEKSLLYRKGNAPYCSTRDVNADARPDLVCQYLVKLTGFQVGDTEGVLVGMTVAGGPFEGRDRVQIVP